MPHLRPVNQAHVSSGLPWRNGLLLMLLVLGVLSPAGASAQSEGVVSGTSGVNIRACPTLDCQVIGSASLGEPIDITGEIVDGFYPVNWYDREGYVFALYVTHSGEAPWFVEGQGSCNRVALVFNIGIGEEPSQTIVDTLIDSETPASMFPMGWWAATYPDYLEQIDEAGFLIGTHGDQQVFLTSLSDDAIEEDVTDSVGAIESVIERDIDEFFTPYAAATDERVRSIVSAQGLLPVGWNVAANDYGPDATEASVYERVMRNVYPGAVIEMHLDGLATEQSTALALPRIIDDLRAEGYEFVTVADMVLPCGE
ncbi:MAG: polysaccharide deacetylase family protein [Chloroflexia bacterium]|nr:polysaccharide deacetylase family protein [Chloroflexia bacterium]